MLLFLYLGLWLATAVLGDQSCLQRSGSCIRTSCCENDNYISNLCSGAASRKCCFSKSSCGGTSSSGSCPVKRFTDSRLVGDPVYVHQDFFPSMRKVTKAASDCNVKVYITHSWRPLRAVLTNTVAPPDPNSNHLVGMAIDMNLETSAGFCNSRCLRARTNRDAECFLSKVQTAGLTWGGVLFNDPVHIDDRRNQRSGYSSLRSQVQAACKHIPRG